MRQLICDNLNGVRTQTILAMALHTPRQGCKPSSAHSGWGGGRDGRAIPGRPGLFLTMGRWPEGMGGWKSTVGNAFGGKWVRKQAATPESWAGAGATTVTSPPSMLAPADEQ